MPQKLSGVRHPTGVLPPSLCSAPFPLRGPSAGTFGGAFGGPPSPFSSKMERESPPLPQHPSYPPGMLRDGCFATPLARNRTLPEMRDNREGVVFNALHWLMPLKRLMVACPTGVLREGKPLGCPSLSNKRTL